MARIRTVKPELFEHEELFDLEKETGLPVRLAFIGLFTCCDRNGRFKWRARTLKKSVMPHDDIDFSRVLDALGTRGFIRKYACGTEVYGEIPTWAKHQVINNRESSSDIPEPEENSYVSMTSTCEARVDDASGTRGQSRQGEGKGKEGKGKEGEDMSAQSTDEDSAPPPDRRKREPSPDDLALASRIFGLILDGNPAAKKPNLPAWADDIRLMREQDGRTLPEIWSLFQWVRKDTFWRPNCLSPAKLREKYDQLVEVRNGRSSRSDPPVNEKFNFGHLDRSGDARAMAESMARHGITVPASDEEIDI